MSFKSSNFGPSPGSEKGASAVGGGPLDHDYVVDFSKPVAKSCCRFARGVVEMKGKVKHISLHGCTTAKSLWINSTIFSLRIDNVLGFQVINAFFKSDVNLLLGNIECYNCRFLTIRREKTGTPIPIHKRRLQVSEFGKQDYFLDPSRTFLSFNSAFSTFKHPEVNLFNKSTRR